MMTPPNSVHSPRRFATHLAATLLGSLAFLAGCGSGGGMTLIALSPSAAQTVDVGQTLTVSATLVNDPGHQGALFSVTGGGSISQNPNTNVAGSTIASAVYTPPGTVTSATAVTITATSGNTPTQTASLAVTINPAPAISTSTLPTGTVATAYTTTLAATGGTGAIKWTLTSGALPTGLALNASTGILSGTPTAFGSFPLTLGVTDSASTPMTVTKILTLTINPQPPTVTTTNLPNGISGTAYSQQLAYSGGGSGGATWTLASGTLPTGLSLSASGLISGTPALSAAGITSNITVTVTIGTQTSTAAALALTILPLPSITTATLPGGNVGIAYSQQLSYTGGSGGAATWAVSSGALPTGLALNTSTGLLSGTPTTANTFTFAITVTVGTQTSAPQSFSVVINSLIITSGSTASGEVGLPFVFQLTAAGGTGPYTWSLAPGSSLPSGLLLDPLGSGQIFGNVNSTSGSPFNITVQVADSDTNVATQPMTITFNPARGSAHNSELNGHYAFQLNGFGPSGDPVSAIGTFVADGAGNITGGHIDSNTTTAAFNSQSILASTYSIASDNRGVISLTTSSGTVTFVVALGKITAGVSSSGYLSCFVANQPFTGTLALQNTSAFTNAALTGGFAFGLSGYAGNSTGALLQRRGLIGELQLNGGNTISSSELLSSSANNANPTVPSSGAISVDATGRATLSLTLPSGGGTLHLVGHVISATQLYLLSTDAASGASPAALLSGQALHQATATFNNASLNGISVMRSQHVISPASGIYAPDAQIGLYTFNGAGSIDLSSDESNGSVSTTNTLAGTYAVASNGRTTLHLSSGLGGCFDCSSPQAFFYLVGPGQGFLLDFATTATGYFEPQTATAFTQATLNGSYALGTVDPMVLALGTITGASTVPLPGTVNVTLDQNLAGSLTPDAALTATYTVTSTGRTTVTTPAGTSILYIISPTKSLLLNSGSIQEFTQQ